MKDEHCLSKLDGVHGAAGAANIVFHHLKYPCNHQTPSVPRLRRVCSPTAPATKQGRKAAERRQAKPSSFLGLLPIHSSGFSFVSMSEIYVELVWGANRQVATRIAVEPLPKATCGVSGLCGLGKLRTIQIFRHTGLRRGGD